MISTNMNTKKITLPRESMSNVFRRKIREILKDRWLYILLLPGVIYFIVFKYVPMWGIVIAFQNYNPFMGITGSEWVGFDHFHRLFTDPNFFMMLRNTILLSVMQLVFAFPLPIIAALMLNELRVMLYKRFVQTLIYVPHFMSWVIVISMFYVIFEDQHGLFQNAMASLGLEKFTLMMSSDWFRPIYILQIIWKETGWGTIIYLAALAGIDPQLYEAARIDGANRWRQLWHITLPSIRSVIVILLILKLGDIFELGFEHVYLMLNPLNREVAEIFDTYVYTTGILNGQFSYSTAIGVFKSLVGLIMVMGANWTAKRLGEEGIY
jgi:putative aldouronate transport system permease protein